MSLNINKELILEGLDCANCASKIEIAVNDLETVASANLNFVTKTLLVQLKNNENIVSVIDEIKNIIAKYEPDVMVKEKLIDNSSKKVLVLMGLLCAGCSAKIEDKVKNINGVNNAYIDFANRKLVIDANNKDINNILIKAKEIIKKIEPDVNVIEEDAHNEEPHNHSHNIEDNKKEFAKLSIGFFIFLIAIIIDSNFWVEFSMFFTSYILVGGTVLLKAIKNILRGQVFDENFLMAIATIGAFSIGEYPEGVAVMLFYQAGEYMQGLAVNKSRKSISELMDIRPDYANLKISNDTKRVSPESVNIEDIIIVKPGEKIPLDGIVIDGTSMVDTSALTGESVPRKVEVNSEVLSGFINTNGILNVKVTKRFEESTVAKILDLVQNASSKKAPTENFITKFARYYTPIVVYSALALALIPPFILNSGSFSNWLYRALVFLVISCPCALVVSIPLGFFGGIGGASKNGILIKGGNYLEALNNVETIIFDKTGTLTKGVFKVTKLEPKNDFSKEELLKYAAYAENYSNHPIATSIIKEYGEKIDEKLIESYDEISGHGIETIIDNKEIVLGNAKLMKKENIHFSEVNTVGTIIYLAINGVYKGYIEISDEIKEDSKIAIEHLKDIGIKNTVMLTGDNRNAAEKIANILNLDDVYYELLPQNKVEKVEEFEKRKSKDSKIVFVGDGINDAPVLARSDIGVAMGGLGSDAAIEAADVVLMTDEPSKIVSAIKIAKRTKKIVWQNIVFSLGVKGIVLILGAIGYASMWLAVFADVGVALIAVLNSMRVLNVKNL